MEPFHDEKDEQSDKESVEIIQQKGKKKRKASMTNDDSKTSKISRIDLISKIDSPEPIVPAKVKSKKVKSAKPIEVAFNNNSKHEKANTRASIQIKKKKDLLLKQKQASGKKQVFALPKIDKFKQKLKKKPSNVPGNKANGISDERLRAFGINPKKYHKKLNWEIKTAGSAVKQTPKISQNTTSRPKNASKKHSTNNKKVSGSPNVKKIIAAKAKQNENNKKKLLKFLGKSPKA